jgi:membrane associated rhomboid family serine protease
MSERTRVFKIIQARPYATYALIAAQMVVWVVARRFLLPHNVWAEFANDPTAPTWLGFMISPFVHLEALHLGVNLLTLWLFGTNLERASGSMRFLMLYLGSAWFASLMHWAAATSFHLYAEVSANPALGSSGAIAGVLAASLVRFARPRLRFPLLPYATFPVTPLIVLWLGYTVVRALLSTLTGISEGVGHWAHLAGFIFGLSAAQLFGFQHAARLEHLAYSGAEATARDDHAAASRSWAALLAMEPSDMAVRCALVKARLAVNDLPGARRVARDGIEALVRAEKRPAALEAYQDYTQLVPELDLRAGVRFRIGCWLAESGDAEGAFRALWESVREDGAPAAAGALYRAGQVAWERLKSPLHAREAWERLLEQFPDSHWSDAARDGLRRLPSTG